MGKWTDKELMAKFKIKLDSRENLEEVSVRNPKIISFYAEKGGVGKTTTCLNLAHTFAKNGKRVLIYDCDVQRSLTAWTFGSNINVDIEDKVVNKVDLLMKKLPNGNMPCTLYEQMTKSNDLENLEVAFAVLVSPNLYVVPGDRNMPKLDTIIVQAESIASAIQFHNSFPNNFSSRPYHLIMKTAKHYKVDYVFLDLNPYPGLLNRCLVMSSNYIIVPLCLDYFCMEMMYMMENNLTDWSIETDKVKNFVDTRFPWPPHKPKFLGYIVNKFMAYNPKPEDPLAFKDLRLRYNQTYFEEKIKKLADHLVGNLGDRRTVKSLSITTNEYSQTGQVPRLGYVTEFYKLADLADLLHKPVVTLTRNELYQLDADGKFREATGEQYKNKQESNINHFKQLYDGLMRSIELLIMEAENR